MHSSIIKNSLLTTILLFTISFISCTNNKTTVTNKLNIDSLTLVKKYDSIYYLYNNDVKILHQTLNRTLDSTLIGLNHQLYSDYLLRNSKLDSAYYYLKLADLSFKNDKDKLFYNSIKKIYLTNRVELFLHSEIVYSRINTDINRKNHLKKWHLDIFQIPFLKQNNPIEYRNRINSIINLNKQDSAIIANNSKLDNYKDLILYKYYLSQKLAEKVNLIATKKIDYLINTNRTNEDLFFTNLFYAIKSKDTLNDPSIHLYFHLYDTFKNKAFTKETEILLYNLKSSYFSQRGKLDSANYYTMQSLEVAKTAKNNYFIASNLKKLSIAPNIDNKKYIKEFIQYNDSVFTNNNKLDDYIFYINSDNKTLIAEQNKIQNNFKKTIIILCVIISVILLYFFILRNRHLTSLVNKRNVYLNNKTKMYQYLLNIKDKLDQNNINENNKVKDLIQNVAIKNIDFLIKDLNSGNIDYENFTNKLLTLEHNVRKISHEIAADKNQTIDLEVLLKDIKSQYQSFFNIEYFIENKITLNEIGFKEALSLLLLLQIMFSKILYKDNLTCFISLFKHPKDHSKLVFKIWTNKTYRLNDEIKSFLRDRNFNYTIDQDETGQTLLINI